MPLMVANTIRMVHKGHAILSPEIIRHLATYPQTYNDLKITLTAREGEVLQLMAKGLNNGGIAKALDISISTVKFHVYNTIDKFGVNTRAELLVLAAKYNLI
jgi:DNA-binding NarL/FixJ family response regulator